MEIKKRRAKSISYGGKRSLKDIKYIVIHFTGNKGDTAKNNADFYATGNTREAGAHFFVDKKSEIWESVPMEYTAWAVATSTPVRRGLHRIIKSVRMITVCPSNYVIAKKV